MRAELNRALRPRRLHWNPPTPIRYPQDNVPAVNFDQCIAEPLRAAAAQEWTIGRSRVLRDGSDATLIVYGCPGRKRRMAAADLLADDGISVEVIDAQVLHKPIDGDMLARVLRPRPSGAGGRRSPACKTASAPPSPNTPSLISFPPANLARTEPCPIA